MRHHLNPRRPIAVVGILTVTLVVLAACGGGSSSTGSADAAYVDAMVTSMSLDSGNPFSETESRCLAEGTVAAIGTDQLEQWGLTPEIIAKEANLNFPDMAEATAKQISTLYFDGDCFDFGDMLGRAMAASTGNTIESDKAGCLADTLSGSQAFRDAFVKSMMGDDSADPFAEVGDIYTVLSDCGIDTSNLGG